jgi:hypothetical protein
LAARFAAVRTGGPLTDCPGFSAFVISLGGRVGEVAEHRALRTGRGDPDTYSSDFEEMSTPVLSADGQRALVYVASTCGRLCGAGSMLHIARQANGEWRVLDRVGLWIS